ncbi:MULTISPECIES: hypothetical protein [Pantoea]|uniref:hypothetical protein n=1 Tax=Pantoea TaxID=53335 RepID=UPI002599FA3F|nr:MULTISPECIES: hypothetical protein [Pantoea]
MQIDRAITVNGKHYVVRVQEYPGGKWRVFDLEHEIHISDVDKETAFDRWKEKAEQIFK